MTLHRSSDRPGGSARLSRQVNLGHLVQRGAMSKEKQDTARGVGQYRENVVLSIVDTPEASQAAVQELTSGGFLESEVALG